MPNFKEKLKACVPMHMYRKSRKSKLKKMLENNLVNLINMRVIGSSGICGHNVNTTLPNYGMKCMIKNKQYKEQLFSSKVTDKIFTSLWIDDKQVVYGTKCNKVSFCTAQHVLFFVSFS